MTVYVRRPAAATAIDSDSLGRIPPRERSFLSRDEFAATYGPDAADLAAVARFADANHLRYDSNRSRASVRLTGDATDLHRAFGLKDGERGSEHVKLPRELEGVVSAVFGLDALSSGHQWDPNELADDAAASTCLQPADVARLYDFPSVDPTGTNALDGSGVCVAILRLGGSSKAKDRMKFFGDDAPEVTFVGRIHDDTDVAAAMQETALDLEVAGTVAPGAGFVVYFAPGQTEHDLIDVVERAVFDRRHNPSIISISWGDAEVKWSKQFQRHLDEVFKYASCLLGVTVCVASGDNGSLDGISDGKAHTDFPASSPHVLACGGTVIDGSSEMVWHDRARRHDEALASGGGISDSFPLPAWQTDADVPPSVNAGNRVGRGVPDVSGHAKYLITLHAKPNTPVRGTSAVAPLWAGYVALLNQALGHPVGYLNPFLYANYARLKGAGLESITAGDNMVSKDVKAYEAAAGWDPCTGLGRPSGTALLSALLE